MNRIKLVALDLDGTLLNEKKELSERNRKALERAASQGVIIVPATGRPLCGLQKAVLSLPAAYALTANGAAVYKLDTRERIYERCIPWEEALRLVRMIREYDVMGDCFIDGYGYGEEDRLCHVDQYAMSEEIRAYIKASRKWVSNLPDYIEKRRCKVEKMTVNFKEKDGVLLWEQEIRERMKKEFPDYEVVKGVPTNLEITVKAATKGLALLHLGELLGIKREEIMACGDSQNDVEMIKAAGLGVAMGNATPEALEAADYVTLTNDEDGVAAVMEKLVIG